MIMSGLHSDISRLVVCFRDDNVFIAQIFKFKSDPKPIWAKQTLLLVENLGFWGKSLYICHPVWTPLPVHYNFTKCQHCTTFTCVPLVIHLTIAPGWPEPDQCWLQWWYHVKVSDAKKVTIVTKKEHSCSLKEQSEMWGIIDSRPPLKSIALLDGLIWFECMFTK